MAAVKGGALKAMRRAGGVCARSQWATVVPQAVRGTVGPRRAASGPNFAASRRGLIMAATRRLRAPSSQEVFFVAQASRGRRWLGRGSRYHGAVRSSSSDFSRK